MNRHLIAMATLIFAVGLNKISVAQEINWLSDLETATSQAADENKLILLHFSADWCRPCKSLEKFVFSSPMVGKAINQKLVPVHVDTDMHPELVKQFSVSEIPLDVVITPSGRVVTKRKSPKTADNYIRMVKQLTPSEVANEQENIELTQKIDRVLNAAKNKKLVSSPKNNDFVGNTPSHVQPAFSKESMDLAQKSRSHTKLVEHTAPAKEFQPRSQKNKAFSAEKAVSRPQRVINDKFFVEKSNAVKEQMAGTVERAERTVNQIADATINNPFNPKTLQATSGVAMSSNDEQKQVRSAAKILTPDFSQQTANAKKAMESKVNSGASATDFQPKIMAKTVVKPAAEPVVSPAKNSKSFQPATQMIDAATGTVEVDPNLVPNKPAMIEKARSQMAAASKKQDISQPTQPIKPEEKFCLNGKCPVTLIKDGKWKDGDREFGCVHRGRTFLFASKDKRDTFLKDPEAYSPILAGFDPVVFHDRGEMVDGSEKHGVFMGKAPQHRIVLFSSKETRDEFQKNPEKFMSTIRMAVEQSNRVVK